MILLVIAPTLPGILDNMGAGLLPAYPCQCLANVRCISETQYWQVFIRSVFDSESLAWLKQEHGSPELKSQQKFYIWLQQHLYSNMHYAILTYGSRGDVQPFIALALGLQSRGYQVTLAAAENFKTFVESYGITFFPLPGNVEELLHQPESMALLKTGSTFAFIKHLQKAEDRTRPQVNAALLHLSKLADVLITSTLNVFYVASIAEKLKKPWAMIIPNPPATPTRQFPFADLDFINFPLYNILTYRLLVGLYWRAYKKRVNTFRISLGLHIARKNMLHVIDKANTLTLYNFSRHLIERPKDWANHYKVTGFFFLATSNTGKEDAVLAAWLQNGAPPLYIGFGSIPVPDPALLVTIVNGLLATGRHRIILCKGWSRLPGLPTHANLFITEQVSHTWLLPQCTCAIFHGGAGTLAAVLRAKIPAVIVSIFGDQPNWGKIVERKKTGVHIRFKKLSTKRLLDAITISQSAAYRSNAVEMGKKIDEENGVIKAVEQLEAYLF